MEHSQLQLVQYHNQYLNITMPVPQQYLLVPLPGADTR